MLSRASFPQAEAGETNVAITANFTEPAKEIAALFREKTGHDAILSFGASGSLLDQIRRDAPFRFSSRADAGRPKAAIGGGHAVPGTLFTYATGKLVLWGEVADVTNGEQALKGGLFSKLSIADQNAAPYGVARIHTMKALGVFDALEPKIVRGSTSRISFAAFAPVAPGGAARRSPRRG
jgi:molybdate transport system substrate-binding protein